MHDDKSKESAVRVTNDYWLSPLRKASEAVCNFVLLKYFIHASKKRVEILYKNCYSSWTDTPKLLSF